MSEPCCPKCGEVEFAKIRFCFSAEYDRHCTCRQGCPGQKYMAGEHLDCECKRCAYTWAEPCKDAKP